MKRLRIQPSGCYPRPGSRRHCARVLSHIRKSNCARSRRYQRSRKYPYQQHDFLASTSSRAFSLDRQPAGAPHQRNPRIHAGGDLYGVTGLRDGRCLRRGSFNRCDAPTSSTLPTCSVRHGNACDQAEPRRRAECYRIQITMCGLRLAALHGKSRRGKACAMTGSIGAIATVCLPTFAVGGAQMRFAVSGQCLWRSLPPYRARAGRRLCSVRKCVVEPAGPIRNDRRPKARDPCALPLPRPAAQTQAGCSGNLQLGCDRMGDGEHPAPCSPHPHRGRLRPGGTRRPGSAVAC